MTSEMALPQRFVLPIQGNEHIMSQMGTINQRLALSIKGMEYVVSQMAGMHPRRALAEKAINGIPDYTFDRLIRPYILHLAGFPQVDLRARIAGDIKIKGGPRDASEHLIIEKGAFLNTCEIDITGKVHIGEYAGIGNGTKIQTAGHNVSTKESGLGFDGNVLALDVNIGDRAWIHSDVLIGPGVTIGRRSVIYTGTFVDTNVPQYCIVKGNPATVIGTISEDGARIFFKNAIPLRDYNTQQKKLQQERLENGALLGL